MNERVSCRDKEAHPEVWTTLISRSTSPKSRKRGFLVALAAKVGPKNPKSPSEATRERKREKGRRIQDAQRRTNPYLAVSVPDTSRIDNESSLSLGSSPHIETSPKLRSPSNVDPPSRVKSESIAPSSLFETLRAPAHHRSLDQHRTSTPHITRGQRRA